jgi:hypothetical protein
MKKIRTTIWLCCIIVIISCNHQNSQKKENVDTKAIEIGGFVLTGTLESYLSDKVYLNKIIENQIYPIDSTPIENNQFIFKGAVKYPERFALTFENYSAAVLLIVENTDFQISFIANQINEPVITGSALNNELHEYELTSKRIFKKIEFLFPQFQKARLENDASKLLEIGNEMKNIEAEFVDYSYNFIKTNRNSFVSAMILHDQLKTPNADTLRIEQTYYLLSEAVKKSPDAQIIASALKLH